MLSSDTEAFLTEGRWIFWRIKEQKVIIPVISPRIALLLFSV